MLLTIIKKLMMIETEKHTKEILNVFVIAFASRISCQNFYKVCYYHNILYKICYSILYIWLGSDKVCKLII